MPPLDSSLAVLLLWAVIGYGLGSVPFGLVLTRAMGLGDLRGIGSGNIGATNVLRTGNKAAAALTLILDAGKGAAAVLIARAAGAEADAVQIAALAAFAGHCFPVWLGFRGGKGVATFLGLWLALAWPVGLACCATWLAAAAVGRMSSLAALVAVAIAPVWAWVLGAPQMIVLALVLGILIFIRHGANIARILRGEEPRIGKKT